MDDCLKIAIPGEFKAFFPDQSKIRQWQYSKGTNRGSTSVCQVRYKSENADVDVSIYGEEADKMNEYLKAVQREFDIADLKQRIELLQNKLDKMENPDE
jgi:hypothetical protein